MCSHWLKFKKSSCQKPRSQLNCDFAGMIIGWSCTKLVNRLPIANSRWPPWLDLVWHWTLWEFHIFIFFSETTKQIWTKLGRNVHWMVIKFQPMRTHYGPWQPCWILNQHQKHKSGRGPSNEHFWQVWLKSVQRFQRRRFKCEKLTDGRRDYGRLPMTKAHMAYGQVS
jgi:hypothetical protein